MFFFQRASTSSKRLSSLFDDHTVLLIAVTFLMFFKTVAFPFINYDDSAYVTENRMVAKGLSLPSVAWAFYALNGGVSYWHPMTWLSHMLDVELFGLDPRAHHLTNTVLHMLNAILLFKLSKRLLGDAERSLLIALMFAIHPLRVESVAWVSERKDVLSMFFGLLSLGSYVDYAKSGVPRSLWFAFGFYVLALMSKPMLVTLPILFVVLDVMVLHRFNIKRWSWTDLRTHWKRLFLDKLAFFIAAAAVGIVTIVAQTSLGIVARLEDISWMQRIENAVVGYSFYVRKFLLPIDLAILYPHPGEWSKSEVVAGLVVLSCLGIIGWGAGSVVRGVRAGIVWYFVTLAPVCGIIQVGTQAYADRYSYLPSIGLTLAFVCGLWHALGGRRFLRITVAAAVCAYFGLLTDAQLSHWQSAERLWLQAIHVNPENPIALNNLGRSYQVQKQLLLAERAYKEALCANPNAVKPYLNLGSVYLELEKYELAKSCFQNAAELDPLHPDVQQGLGFACLGLKDYTNCVRHLTRAIGKHASLPHAYYGLSRAVRYVRFSLDGQPLNATRLAEVACEVNGFQDPVLVWHYAKMLAEGNDRKAARAIALRALAALSEPSGKAFREDILTQLTLWDRVDRQERDAE